ncbi:MAG: thioesterase family protein [Rhizobiaceae bacterium]
MPVSAPFLSAPMPVEKDWIDYNGHMNMAYYNVLFDRCADQAFDRLGIGADYLRDRGLSIYTAEIHVCYLRELHLGDAVRCTFHLVDHDEKRLHVYQELSHVDGWLSATCEALSLHVDMSGPRVAAFPGDIAANVAAMAADHAAVPRPDRIGRTIGIRRKAG